MGEPVHRDSLKKIGSFPFGNGNAVEQRPKSSTLRLINLQLVPRAERARMRA